MKNEVEKLYQKHIYEWVKQNFGESEAEDPSWNIEALAQELTRHFHELYWQQELEYLKEDVGMYAEDHGYFDLTDQQIYNVADKIRNSEWYCSINPDDLEYYIKEELKKGEK